MKNQQILNAPKLYIHEKWIIHRYSTPNHMHKPKDWKFEDFSKAIWKISFDGYHLFELRNDTVVIMCWCRIETKNK